jgi:hypothetical protein
MEWTRNNQDQLFPGLVFLEDQDGSNKEVSAMQYGVQAVLGPERCFPVSPQAVKSHFPEVFPRVDPPRTRSRQRESDKRNAVKGLRPFLSEDMRKHLKGQGAERDMSDAGWIAKYAEEKFFRRKKRNGAILDLGKERRKHNRKEGISRRKDPKPDVPSDQSDPESDNDLLAPKYSLYGKEPGAPRKKHKKKKKEPKPDAAPEKAKAPPKKKAKAAEPPPPKPKAAAAHPPLPPRFAAFLRGGNVIDISGDVPL